MSGEEVISRVRELKWELSQTLSRSPLSKGSDGELAAIAALAETAAEYGIIYLGHKATALVFKQVRLKVIQDGRLFAMSSRGFS